MKRLPVKYIFPVKSAQYGQVIVGQVQPQMVVNPLQSMNMVRQSASMPLDAGLQGSLALSQQADRRFQFDKSYALQDKQFGLQKEQFEWRKKDNEIKQRLQNLKYIQQASKELNGLPILPGDQEKVDNVMSELFDPDNLSKYVSDPNAMTQFISEYTNATTSLMPLSRKAVQYKEASDSLAEISAQVSSMSELGMLLMEDGIPDKILQLAENIEKFGMGDENITLQDINPLANGLGTFLDPEKLSAYRTTKQKELDLRNKQVEQNLMISKINEMESKIKSDYAEELYEVYNDLVDNQGMDRQEAYEKSGLAEFINGTINTNDYDVDNKYSAAYMIYMNQKNLPEEQRRTYEEILEEVTKASDSTVTHVSSSSNSSNDGQPKTNPTKPNGNIVEGRTFNNGNHNITVGIEFDPKGNATIVYTPNGIPIQGKGWFNQSQNLVVQKDSNGNLTGVGPDAKTALIENFGYPTLLVKEASSTSNNNKTYLLTPDVTNPNNVTFGDMLVKMKSGGDAGKGVEYTEIDNGSGVSIPSMSITPEGLEEAKRIFGYLGLPTANIMNMTQLQALLPGSSFEGDKLVISMQNFEDGVESIYGANSGNTKNTGEVVNPPPVNAKSAWPKADTTNVQN